MAAFSILFSNLWGFNFVPEMALALQNIENKGVFLKMGSNETNAHFRYQIAILTFISWQLVFPGRAGRYECERLKEKTTKESGPAEPVPGFFWSFSVFYGFRHLGR